MPDIIDVSYACGSEAGFLAGAGVKTIIRYYSRNTGLAHKRLTRQEALAHATAGLNIATVHEARRGDLIDSFNGDLGELDGSYAREYAARAIGQPANSAIYFAVDLDPAARQIGTSVMPFFQGVASAFAAQNSLPGYRVGVYGSGATCEAVLGAGLAQLAWLAQSRRWTGYKKFLQSNRWSLLQGSRTSIGEIDCDSDKSAGDFGSFLPVPASGEASMLPPLTVIARPGVRLRAGPSTDFDTLQLIPFGAIVHPVKTVGDWTLVDLVGDAAVDGFVNSHFLRA